MFTGIVEETGTVASIQKNGRSARLSVKGGIVFDELGLGDSVAVNGVCLTVAGMKGNVFWADVMNETFSRTNLERLGPGSRVNLERATRADGRFGGHMVYGHIDGVGRIIKKERDDNAVWIAIAASGELLRYIVEKGSIAVDGISLTVARTGEGHFSVSVVPHTGRTAALTDKKVGDTVNLENDIVGKYIERFLKEGTELKQKNGLTAAFLANAGF